MADEWLDLKVKQPGSFLRGCRTQGRRAQLDFKGHKLSVVIVKVPERIQKRYGCEPETGLDPSHVVFDPVHPLT